MRWIVRGDIDGFFGLALDNLVQLLLVETLCQFVLGFPPGLIYGRVLPGAAVSILVGNLFYAFQAKKLAERTGRTDVCALPYGINTVSLIAHVFLVMLPAKVLATRAGALDPARVAWQAGLFATFCSGFIELALAFIAERVRKATPRAALLSTLAGIALGFISLGFLFRTFARPTVGLTTLGIVMLTYFGRVRFKGRIPGGMVAVGLGTLLSWIIGIAPVGEHPAGASLHLPVPVIGDLLTAIGGGHLLPYLSVIIAMGLFNVLGSLQNIESAEAAGDSYDTRSSLMVNGAGSIIAAVFGSAFPTTIYIGHPGWKALGARAGYSVLNGAFITIICITGTLAWIAWAIPIDAGMAIVLWIGIVISAQAFQTTPRALACGHRGFAPRNRRLGSVYGEKRSPCRWTWWESRPIQRRAYSRVWQERRVDPGYLLIGARLSIHRHAAFGGNGWRDRTKMGDGGEVVRGGLASVRGGPDALVPVDGR